MLKLAGESSIGLERIEQLTYSPGVKDTNDLEAGTKTITATSEASGTGNADYNAALTLPNPSDVRVTIKRLVARLAVTIDSFDTATHLYCRVYVDAQDADHRLFDMDWDSTGAKLTAVDKTSGTIFDLLSDGAAHTFYFFFWIDQANNAVISLVQLWEGVGTCSTSRVTVLELDYTGFMMAGFHHPIVRGTGSAVDLFCIGIVEIPHYIEATEYQLLLVKSPFIYQLYGTVATDANCYYSAVFVLRSET